SVAPFSPDVWPPRGQVFDADDATVFPEKKLNLPWSMPAESSWIDYRIWVEILLDPGYALHKPLPQQQFPVDTLASVVMDGSYDKVKDFGANLSSQSTAVDIAQRMATSTYHFALKGWALRAGYKIPVPSLVSVGRAGTIPDHPQWTTGNVL